MRVCLCVRMCASMRVHSSCPCAAIKQLVNFSALGTRTRCQLPVGGCLRLLPPKIARVATQAAQAVCLQHGNSWELSTRLFFCTPFVCSLYNCNVLFSPSLFPSLLPSLFFSLCSTMKIHAVQFLAVVIVVVVFFFNPPTAWGISAM